MNQARRLLSLLPIGLAVSASLAGVAPVARADGDEGAITVTAKLVEIPSKATAGRSLRLCLCDEVRRRRGSLDKTSILVAHYKPLQPRSMIKEGMKGSVDGKLRSFSVGDTHKMNLLPDLKKVWKGPLLDEFAATDRKSIRYWCLQVDPA